MRLRIDRRPVLVQRPCRRRATAASTADSPCRRRTRSATRWTSARRRSAAATSTTASSRPTRSIPMSNKGLSDFDIRHNFVYNSTWELPFGQSLTGLARGARVWLAALGHRDAAAPASRSARCSASTARGCCRARAAPGSGPIWSRAARSIPCSAAPTQYFDSNCFALPAAGTLGNLPRNTLHRSGLRQPRHGDLQELHVRRRPPPSAARRRRST